MIAFIGLGNPGPEYFSTKHNAGFWVLDELAERWKVNFSPGKGPFVFAAARQKKILLAKPTTGMNVSGIAVRKILNFWKLNINDIHVIVDDVDLPLGTLRVRPHGGDGCHRGMESIIYQIKDNQFPRIRFGIADGTNTRPAEKYVLRPFQKKDQIEVNEMVKTAADVCESIFYRGINYTMNKYNRKELRRGES